MLLLVLLLVLVLHEAIVEVWRRRSGVVLVLTGIVRVWCRLGLLTTATLAMVELRRIESERASSPGAGRGRSRSRSRSRSNTSSSSRSSSVRSRVERSLVF